VAGQNERKGIVHGHGRILQDLYRLESMGLNLNSGDFYVTNLGALRFPSSPLMKKAA
jgi:hypothetical protein